MFKLWQKTRLYRKNYETTFIVVVLLFVFAGVVASYNLNKADAAFPKYLNFQGKLTKVSDGTNVANGTYAVRFKIYDALTSGTLLWTETYDQAPVDACQKLQVTNGVFNAKLGSCNPLTIDVTAGDLYLSVDFAPTGTSYDGEMSPRKQLVASAFAFNANNVVGDGRIDIAYAPGTSTYSGGKIDFAPSVSSAKNSLELQAGANVTGAALKVTQAGTGLGIDLAGAGSLSRTINSTSAALALQTTTSGNITMSPAASSGVVMTQAVATSSTPSPILTITAAAHTTLANAEATDFSVNLARTVQFTGTSTLATQRAARITAPTYSSDTATKTITDAVTFAISGAPVKSTNVAITNSYALKVEAGAISTATNGYGLFVDSPTGATNNYAAVFSTGNVGVGTSSPGEKLEIVGNIISKGTSWTTRTSAADNFWTSITYGNGLFVAVSYTGSSNRVMTSPDGVTWTTRTPAVDNQWISVTYGNGLFVAVSTDGTGNRVMTSPDGITWTSRSSAADNFWESVTYGKGLFVAVSGDGSGNRVMTSPDGVTWTSQTSAADNTWTSVTYGNGLFVAVSGDGSGNRVMTSPDGVTWTSQTSAANNAWNSVVYGNGLFVAVASTGSSDQIMTSPNGTAWTTRTNPVGNQWKNVTYGNGLFVSVALTGTGDRVMTSPDGITWKTRASAADNQWYSVAYGNGVFAAVSVSGSSNRVMTSGKVDNIAFSANNIYQGGLNVFGGVGIGTSSPSALLHIAGNRSQAAWGLNGLQFQAASSTYTDTSSSGTVTNVATSTFGTPTIAASSSTTYTNAANLYVAAAPSAGTNVTLTNAYALWVDDGTSRFDGKVTVGPEIVMDVYGRIFAGTSVSQGYDASLDVGFMVTPRAGTPSALAMVVQGLGSQSGDLTQWRDNTPTVIAKVTAAGDIATASVLQAGSTTITTYSRLGSGTTGHSLNAANDLLISDDLEVDGDAFFDGNLTVTGTCTGCGGGASSLQGAYDGGNTITTASATNVAITLAEVATPTSFTIDNQDTAGVSAQRVFNSIASGTLTNGLLIEQTGAGTMTNGIQIAETAGTITDGILITGTLGNILNSSSLDITGAGAITGATGITTATGNFTATAGDLVFGATTRLTNAGVGTLITGTVIGSQTFTTNNISDSGALTVNSTSGNLALQTTTSGNITLAPASTGSVQITSGVTSGTGTSGGFSVAANSITSGHVLSVTSTKAASFTGNLIDISLSDGTGASSNTGSLLMLTNAGTANANTALYVKHYATGTNNLALRVDDVSGDSTPFVVTGAGDVGIGTSGPGFTLEVNKNVDSGTEGTYPELRVVNSNAGSGTGSFSAVSIEAGNSSPVIVKMLADFTGASTAVGAVGGANGTKSNHPFVFYTNNTRRTVIDISGNFGINDFAPTGKRLAVVNSGAVTTTQYGAHISNTSTSSTASIDKYGLYVTNSGSFAGSTTNVYGIRTSSTPTGTPTLNYGLYVDTPTGGATNYGAIIAGGNVGIGDVTPDALLTVGSGELFQVSSTGVTTITPGQSTTAFTVGRTGTTYALQVDTNTTNSVTGLKVTAAASAGGLDLGVISSGSNEPLRINAKGSGTIALNGTATGDIYLAGGGGSVSIGSGAASGGKLGIDNIGSSDNVVALSLSEGANNEEFSIRGMFGSTGSNGNAIKFYSGAFSTDNILYMRGDGRIGIGVNIGTTITSKPALDVDLPDQTGLSTEEIVFRSNNTSQGVVSAGTITNMRANQFLAQTINGVAGGGTETVTNAATLYVDNAPSGSNITITNPYALWVDDGTSRFDGDISATAGNLIFNGTTRITNAGVGTLITGTAIGSQTFTTNNISDSGALTIASGSATNLTLNKNGGNLIFSGFDCTGNTNGGALTADASGVISCSDDNGGGGAITPWTSAIDADGFALQDALNIEFRTAAGSAPAGSVIALYADNSGDLTANVLTGKTANIAVNGTDEYNFSSTAIAMNSNNITGLGTAITATAGLTITGTSANLALATATSGNITLAPASTGSVQITSGVTTGSGTTAGLSVLGTTNALTSGTLIDFTSSTTGAASNTQKILNVSTTGANSTGTQTTYGGYFTNTHSGSSSTNIAAYFSATSGTNNYAAIFENGNVGIGITAPTSLFHIQQAADSTNTSTPVAFDINSVGAAGELTASSGTQIFARIAPTINQTSTAGYTGLLINATQTAIGTGTKRFADFQIGGTTKIALNNGTTIDSGANAIAGIFGDYTLTNATGSGFEFGNRFLTTVNGGTAGTHVGEFIRVTDSTSLASGQVVRGIEVQAYSGTNNNGTNVGITSYGKTFGLHGVTTSQAGTVSQPAAVFADLDNGTDSTTKTLGNAIRAYTNDATSADLVSFYQETSAYTGNGLVMDFGNNSGSFSGNFLNLKEGGTSRFTFADTGRMDILTPDADNAISFYLNTEESTATQSVFAIESDSTGNSQSADTVKAHFEADGKLFISLTGTQTTHAVCHTGSAKSNNDELVDCDPSAGADYAEMYPVSSDVSVGDVVSLGNQLVNTYNTDGQGTADWNSVKGQINQLVKSTKAYQSSLIGVVSDNTADFSSTGYNLKLEDNPKPIALNGRVLVKVTSENGQIHAGDFVTSSSTVGKAMKATKPGMIIGQALADDAGTGLIMVFVHTSYYDPTTFIDDNGNIELQHGTSSTKLTAQTETTAAYIVDQKGSGDILQLQQNGSDRFLVQNNGSLQISTIASNEIDSLVVVKNGSNEVFNINARGDLAVKGILLIKDDNFAGSIQTQEDGLAEITFTYDLGTGKPVMQLTAEGENPIFAQIKEWKKDDQERYTGVVIKTFTPSGQATPAIVHYLIVAKQKDYETFGLNLDVLIYPNGQDQTINVGDSSSGDSSSSDGTVAGDSTENLPNDDSDTTTQPANSDPIPQAPIAVNP